MPTHGVGGVGPPPEELARQNRRQNHPHLLNYEHATPIYVTACGTRE